jgi:hypothetical protein
MKQRCQLFKNKAPKPTPKPYLMWVLWTLIGCPIKNNFEGLMGACMNWNTILKVVEWFFNKLFTLIETNLSHER